MVSRDVQFRSHLAEYLAADRFIRPHHLPRLLGAMNQLMATEEGMRTLLAEVPAIARSGIFDGTSWEDPSALVPSLAGGTLRSDDTATAELEILSDLRMLSLARGELRDPRATRRDARRFLSEVVVHNVDLAFPGPTEHDRHLDPERRKRVANLFALVLESLPTVEVRARLAEEVELMCAQRPIVTGRVRNMLHAVARRLDLDRDDGVDARLLRFLDAIEAPTPMAAANHDPAAYAQALRDASAAAVDEEAELLGGPLRDTGLASGHHAVFARHARRDARRLARMMGLNAAGTAELDEHLEWLSEIIERAVSPAVPQTVYGLALALERGVFSREPVQSGLARMLRLELDDEVADRVRKAVPPVDPRAPRDILLADALNVLGQPLGIGQGWSPTCQSARGISLWSQHAPGKLLDLLLTAAATNDLEMRFEGAMIHSKDLPEGLLQEVDYSVDAVSVVLVPHLDRIYNEMMRRATARGDDPHRWVNPGLYGHWIPTGFRSFYDATLDQVADYEGFVRLFYATHHPRWNGGHDLLYPNPVGILITTAAGVLLGFHAVSLLRVAEHEGSVRAYFLNPNDEGRQDWGQDITPTVSGNGERAGESSLPFEQFVSRLYAYHYNPRDAAERELDEVADPAIPDIVRASRESWGRQYRWA